MKPGTIVNIAEHSFKTLVNDLDVYYCLGEYVSMFGDGVVLPLAGTAKEFYTGFFDWLITNEFVECFAVEDESIIEKEFLTSKVAPHPEGMKTLSETLVREKDHRLELLCAAPLLSIFREEGFDMTMIAEWLASEPAKTEERIEEVKISVIRELLMRAAVDDTGFGIMAVGGSDEQPSFCYTQGLAEKHGVEIFAVGLPPGIFSYFVSECVLDQVVEEMHIPDIGGTIAGEPARGQLIEIDELPGPLKVVGKMDSMRWFQLLVGDKNNILPGEEGYDETQVQTL